MNHEWECVIFTVNIADDIRKSANFDLELDARIGNIDETWLPYQPPVERS